jgi:hypothetical protein
MSEDGGQDLWKAERCLRNLHGISNWRISPESLGYKIEAIESRPPFLAFHAKLFLYQEEILAVETVERDDAVIAKTSCIDSSSLPISSISVQGTASTITSFATLTSISIMTTSVPAMWSGDRLCISSSLLVSQTFPQEDLRHNINFTGNSDGYIES